MPGARHCLSVLALVVGCAGASGPVEDELAESIDPFAQSQRELEGYLEATQPLDAGNTHVVHDVAVRGRALVPALVALLGEREDEAALYHLIRLGCTMIQEGRVDAAQGAELRAAMDAAQARMWYGSDEARLSRARLRECAPPASGLPRSAAEPGRPGRIARG
jgi:hypothetical protein